MPKYEKKAILQGVPAKEIYAKVAGDIERLLRDSGVSVKCQFDPGLNRVQLDGSMFSGTILCFEGELVLDASISLMALPFRSMLDSKIQSWLERTFQV